MDLNQAIKKGIFEVLDANVIYNGSPLPVFDEYTGPDEVPYPYILITSLSSSQISTKNYRPSRSSAQVEVVTGFLTPSGKKQSQDIMHLVDQIINPDSRLDVIIDGGFSIGDTISQRSFEVTSRNAVYYIFRKINIYNFLVSSR